MHIILGFFFHYMLVSWVLTFKSNGVLCYKLVHEEEHRGILKTEKNMVFNEAQNDAEKE